MVPECSRLLTKKRLHFGLKKLLIFITYRIKTLKDMKQNFEKKGGTLDRKNVRIFLFQKFENLIP